MSRLKLPAIRVDARYAPLKFQPLASALTLWDKSIEARAPTSAEVRVDMMGIIGEDVTDRSVRATLNAAGKAPLRVYLNSPGGVATEGIAIYEMLRDHPATVTVEVLSLAASVASLIAMAADRVEMRSASRMMIHSSHAMFGSLNQAEMRKYAELLDSFDQDVAKVYAARSKKSVAQVLEWMSKETYMNAEQAVANGFADVVLADKRARSQDDQPILASIPASVLLAASGDKARPVVRLSATPPGASGSQSNLKGKNMRTIAEQIGALEAKRQASAAAREAIQNKAIEAGRSKDEAEKQEFDTLSGEITTCDSELVDLRLMEKQVLAKATVITPAAGADPEAGTKVRAPVNTGIISVRQNIEPGVRFARAAISLFLAKGNRQEAAHIFSQNRRWMDQTPEIHKVLMTAIPAADTTTAGWASELAYAQNMQSEFIDFLRPMTILGRVTGTRPVPFNMRVSSLTGGTTGYWVGQGKAIPMSKGTTGSLSLGITKLSGLAAYDDEILKLSSPSIELMVRDDLGKAVAQVIDVAFIDPNNGGITNEKPASVLYGVTPITPSGTDAAAIKTDVAAVFAASIAANLDPMSGVWIMSPTSALKLSLMMTTNGIQQYPGISIKGGTWQGLPVIVSPNVVITGSPQFGSMIVLLLANEVFLADDGDVDIQISNEASFEMLDNPTNLSTGGTAATSVVSMFQTQSWAIKAVRYVNWLKRRTAAAAFIQAALYA